MDTAGELLINIGKKLQGQKAEQANGKWSPYQIAYHLIELENKRGKDIPIGGSKVDGGLQQHDKIQNLFNSLCEIHNVEPVKVISELERMAPLAPE